MNTKYIVLITIPFLYILVGLYIFIVSCQKAKSDPWITQKANEIVVIKPEIIWIEIEGIRYRLDCLVEAIIERHVLPTPYFMDNKHKDLYWMKLFEGEDSDIIELEDVIEK